MSQVIVTIQPGSFSLVGMGPLTVQIENGQPIYVVQQSGQPVVGVVTTQVTLQGTDNTDFPLTQQVWAMPIPGAVNQPVTIGVSYDSGNYAGAGQQVLAPGSNAIGSVTANIGVTGGLALEAGHLATIDTKIPALVGGSVPVVLTAGTATIGNVGVTSSVLPTGAATQATLASIDTKVPATVGGSVPVVLTASTATIGNVTANIGVTGGLALEAGHLATIDTKIPALGQALAASSVPVVLTATQLSTLAAPVATLAAGTAAIGSVTVSTLPALPTGTNTIGTVTLGAGNATIGNTYDEALATIVDSTSNALYVYFCEALPGTATSAAAWRCSRLTLANGQTQWADTSTGTGAIGSFKDIANNRAALTYA